MEHGHHQQLQYQQQEAQLAHLQQRYTSHPYNRAAAYIPNAQSMIHTPLYVGSASVHRYSDLHRYCQRLEGELLHLLYRWIPRVRPVASEPRACQLQLPASHPPPSLAPSSLPVPPNTPHSDYLPINANTTLEYKTLYAPTYPHHHTTHRMWLGSNPCRHLPRRRSRASL